jgi:hypothetical protein
MSQEEIIYKNWTTFRTQLEKINEKTPNLTHFLDQLEELELPTTPASTKFDLVCAYPGGLVEHSLRVLSYVAKLRKVYGFEKEISGPSAVLVSLLHDIGKTGHNGKPYYLAQDDDWKKNKLGQMYEINQKLAFMPVSQLSLKLLTQHSFTLDIDEWYAIYNVRETTKEQYLAKTEPKLSILLNQAITIACLDGKSKKEAMVI